MKFKFIFFTFFIFYSSFSAQEESLPVSVKTVLDTLHQSKKEMLPADSLLKGNYKTDNTVYPKNFTDNFQKKYKGKDFDYSILKPHESLWERIKRNVNKILNKIFGDLDPLTANRYTINILRILGVLVLGFLLYYLIKYLNSKNGNFFFGKKNRKLAPAFGEIQENIHEINFPELIQKFEIENDYRSAIRYQFLSILKSLADKNKIIWMPEKTNQDYVLELKDETSKTHFLELAYIFDYVWYGEFLISQKDYEYYKEKFINTKF